MARRPNLIPSIYLNLALPLDVHTRLTAHLYSELEGRVPLGLYSQFITERLREAFEGETLDLAAYGSAPSGVFVLRGSAAAIKHLRNLLSQDSPP